MALTKQQVLFNEIQDLIGPGSLWPPHILNWFFYGIPVGEGVTIKKRPLLAAFCWVNGLNPEVLYDWCKMNYPRHTEDDILHYKWLFAAFDRGDLKNMFAWNVSQGRSEYLNGTYCKREKNSS